MNNIIIVKLDSTYTAVYSGIWQWNYGQILRIQGGNLPKVVEVHFSFQDKGGDSITRIGTTVDGATDVPIPDSFLENGGRAQDYKIYAFIYLEDGTAGNTEYKIEMSVKSRPKPEVPGTPEEPELFRETVKAVNDAADRAETAEQNAKTSATEAGKYAASASESAVVAEKTKEDALREVREKKQEAIEAIQEQEETSAGKIVNHTDNEIKRIQNQTAESKGELEQTIANAGVSKEELDESIQTAGDTKTALDKSTELAGTAKTELDTSTQKAGEAKTALDGSARTAGEMQETLNATVKQASALDTSLGEKIETGTQLKTDLVASGEKAVQDIQAAGSEQLDKMKAVAEEFTADREQITTNKENIGSLKEDLVDKTNLYVGGTCDVRTTWYNKANGSDGNPTVDNTKRLISDLIPIPLKSSVTVTRKLYTVSCSLIGFDESKTRTITLYPSANPIVLTENDCAYFRLLAQNKDDSDILISSADDIYSINVTYVSEDKADIEELQNDVEYLSDVKVTERTPQLFDRTKVSVGFMNTSGGVDSDSTGYVYTEKIDVSDSVGKTIYFSIDGVAKGVRFLCAFDSNNNPISESGINDGTMITDTYTIPSGVKYIVITYKNPSSKPAYARFQAEYDEITPYTEYGKVDRINLNLIEKYAFDFLCGKKWAVLGDSFTDGVLDTVFTDGKYKGNRKTYPYFIGNRTGIDIVNFFGGGRTLAYPSDGSFTNSITNPYATWYYQNIPTDVDYITIYLGINDSNHRTGSGITDDGEDATGIIPIGTVDDTDASTYGGAWNVVLSWLIENRPFAHIGIIVSNGCYDSTYRDLQIAIARKYGIPFIDLNGDDRTPVMIRSVNPNVESIVKNKILIKQRVSETNTHPNDDAHEYESYFIEQFLRSI